VHDQDNRGTEIGRDLGIEGQLGAARHVCVVRTDDQDHIKSISQLAEAFDDHMQGLVGILPGCVVGNPDGLVIGLCDAWLVHQKINSEVEVLASRDCRGQWPKHPDRSNLPGQRVQ
jgi:hypothetical protein